MGKEQVCKTIARKMGILPQAYRRITGINQLMGMRDATILRCHGWDKVFRNEHEYQEFIHRVRLTDTPIIDIDY
jgi:hypothetical protein